MVIAVDPAPGAVTLLKRRSAKLAAVESKAHSATCRSCRLQMHSVHANGSCKMTRNCVVVSSSWQRQVERYMRGGIDPLQR